MEGQRLFFCFVLFLASRVSHAGHSGHWHGAWRHLLITSHRAGRHLLIAAVTSIAATGRRHATSRVLRTPRQGCRIVPAQKQTETRIEKERKREKGYYYYWGGGLDFGVSIKEMCAIPGSGRVLLDCQILQMRVLNVKCNRKDGVCANVDGFSIQILRCSSCRDGARILY